MFSKNGKANSPRSSAVTIIGPSASVSGNIAFSGYLRVQGSVVGNVTCNSDASGTTVVHGAGSVAGAIKTPNIVVGGRVEGPLEAAESIEIHEGAAVVGDARYKLLAIQEGGFIDGNLIPTAPAEKHVRPHQERRIAEPEAPAIKELDGPHAHDRRASDRIWRPGKLGLVAVAIIALGAFYWLRHDKAPAEPVVPEPPRYEAPTPAPVEPVLPPKVEEPPPPAPKVEVAPPPAPRPEPKPAATVVPPPVAVPAASPELPKADPNKVVTVQGMDLDKPADVFFVSTKEPAVLFKKQRSDTGDGIRIELGSGAKRRFSISESEVVRVARGNNLEMFYQGRKLSTTTINSGAWISFVPLVEVKPAAPQ